MTLTKQKKKKGVTANLWGPLALGIIIGSVIGTFSTWYVQEKRFAKLEAETEELKNRLKENIATNTSPATKPVEQSQTPAPPTIVSESEHTQLTNAAWQAFGSQGYEASIVKVDECIGKYEIQALEEQKDFSAKKLPPPLKGRPNNESEKEEVFSHGVLNDVATCYFIKGQALEKLKRIEEAKLAYEKARKFPDARTWDIVRGEFWSPAIGASNKLLGLNKSL